MLTRPRWVLHAEGAAIFVLASLFYRQGHFSWWMFVLLFFSPDVSMLGYVGNVKFGAALYNLVHTLTGPICLLLVTVLLPAGRLMPYVLIWLAHLGFDRMLGYGLKYPTFFRDTHLQHV